MNSREKRIRILDLQDQYCQICEYQRKEQTHCLKKCVIGKEMYQLGKELAPERSKREMICHTEEWDKRCQHALKLRQEGKNNLEIAKQFGCHIKTLQAQMRKRSLS